MEQYHKSIELPQIFREAIGKISDHVVGKSKKLKMSCQRFYRKHAASTKLLQHEWSYDGEEGPHAWAKHFPEGLGHRQSPIDIDISKVEFDPTLAPLKFNYERCKALSIFNSGHGFQVKFDETSPAILSGGPFGSDEYQLSQFHGHWGDSNEKHGSEHTVNGRSFPSELHFVHFNKKYGSVAEAAKHGDGLAVVGVFLKVTPNKKHKELQQLIDDFKLIDYDNHDVPLDFHVHPVEFMPRHGKDPSRYFTYLGSLTTPPLSECVVWVLMADALEVEADQMAHFHDLHDHSGHEIEHNYRPVQPLNDRVVKAAFKDFEKSEAATKAPCKD